MATKYELINILRESNPDITEHFTDEELWNMARARSGVKNLPTWEEEVSVKEPHENLYRNIPESQQPVNNIDVSPENINTLKKSIFTYGGLSQEMLGEGISGEYGRGLLERNL